jgi:hypothetical protein
MHQVVRNDHGGSLCLEIAPERLADVLLKLADVPLCGLSMAWQIWRWASQCR